MKTDLMNSVTRSFHKVGFKLKKHSPEILVVAGVIGGVTAAVMACKATTKAKAVVEDTKEKLDMVQQCVESGEAVAIVDGQEVVVAYDAEDGQKDSRVHIAKAGLEFAKLYGPAIGVGLVSIGMIFASNNILRKRNVALAAAATALEQSFKEYRGRVVERFGKELDRELRYNIKAKEVEETVVDENGKEKTVKRTVQVVDPNTVHSIYSVVFCEGSNGWTKNAELNKVFLIQQQEAANYRLKKQGVLTLNEVYDMLGVRRTKYGQIAGWVYTGDGTAGDDFVDFGMFDVTNEKACEFLNGDERSFILDFNCIGNVLDYI